MSPDPSGRLRTSPPTRVEVATGGDPEAAMAKALAAYGTTRTGGVFHASIAHDDSCPCVTSTKPLRACTCEIIYVSFRRRLP